MSNDPRTLLNLTDEQLGMFRALSKRTATLPFTWEQLAPPREPTSKTWVEVDPDELEAYKRWLKRYEHEQAVGREAGWLLSGYEGDELVEPKGRWVYQYGD